MGTPPALIRDVPKRYWLIREPYYQHQWTFLIGTNWDTFPDFSRHGFVTIDSPHGREIMRLISYARGHLA
jgi:hypothetical protein